MARSEPRPGAHHTGSEPDRPDGTARDTKNRPDDTTDGRCPECNGELATDDREQHCTACGLIVEVDTIDHGPEWRPHAGRPDETGHNLQRCNGASRTETLHDHGLGTRIGTSGDEPASAQLSRMKKHNRQAKFETKRDRNLGYGFAQIRRMVDDVNAGRSVQERACRLYRRAQDADLFVGNSLELVAAACVYTACREQSLPRLPSDVAAVMGLTDEEVPGDGTAERAVQQMYGTICRELGLQLMPLSPADHVPRIISALEAHDATRVEALRLARLSDDHQQFVGRSPSGVAAAAVYLAGQHTEAGITQTAIAEAIDVTPVTIREIADLLAAADAEDAASDQPDEEPAAGDAAATASDDVEAADHQDVEPVAASDEGAAAEEGRAAEPQPAANADGAVASASPAAVAVAGQLASVGSAEGVGDDADGGRVLVAVPAAVPGGPAAGGLPGRPRQAAGRSGDGGGENPPPPATGVEIGGVRAAGSRGVTRPPPGGRAGV